MSVISLSFQKRGSKKPLVEFYSEYILYKKKNTKSNSLSNNDVFNNICKYCLVHLIVLFCSMIKATIRIFQFVGKYSVD